MSTTRAKLLLIAVFIARGTSFLFSKVLLQSMSPMSILAVRFCLAFLVLAAVFSKKLRTCDRSAMRGGVVLGALCVGKVMLVDHMLMGTEGVDLTVALTVGLTLSVTVLCAKLVGCTLPMFAKKLGFDPAVMASPFITTIVDALSLLVYFGLATALLKL